MYEMAKTDTELTLKGLREKYPEVKAISKKEFLKKLKAHLEALKAADRQAPPPEIPSGDEKPAETKKEPSAPAKAPADVPQKPEKAEKPAKKSKSGLSALAQKYSDENGDLLEEAASFEKETVIIVGSKKERYFKVLRYRGQFGPTSTIHASRGNKYETVVAIAKAEA